ncbi:MAG: diguanylate cyclase [Hahellaceae bacterium]|nr:diguanylate cyclase [Hahellaceae bacterium]
MPATSKRSLHALILTALVSISCISVLALGGFLISLEVHTLQSQSIALAKNAQDTSLQQTANRVEQLVSLIEARQKDSRDSLHNTLKTRVREAEAQAHEILSHQSDLPPIIQKDLIINALRPVRFNNGRSFITIMDSSGIVLLAPEQPKTEGQHYSRYLDEMDGIPMLTMISRAASAREGFIQQPPYPDSHTDSSLWFYRVFPDLGWIVMAHESVNEHRAQIQKQVLEDIALISRLDELNIAITNDNGQSLFVKGNPENSEHALPPRRVAGWNWTVSAAPVMVQDAQKLLLEKEALKQRVYLRILAMAVAIVMLMITAVLLSFWIAKRINRQLQHFLEDIRTFALENKPIDTSHLDIREFFQIAQTANRFSKQRAQMLLELERLSQRDPLTDLYNRRHMSEILILEEARIKRNKGSFGLIIADIDHFKRINDSHGHEAGDMAIKSVANLLKDTLRKHDQISRWGGEEFLIILPDASPVATLKVAEKLVAVTRKLAINYKGKIIEPTLTCGVTYHDARLDLAESIDRADQALYEGKRSGRNCVVPKAPMSYAMAAGA